MRESFSQSRLHETGRCICIKKYAPEFTVMRMYYFEWQPSWRDSHEIGRQYRVFCVSHRDYYSMSPEVFQKHFKRVTDDRT